MILMKDIIREGHPTLTKKASEVTLPLSKEDLKTLVSLHEYVVNSQDDDLIQKYKLRPAVGIAAPQINISKRMFAVHVQDLDGNLYSLAVINPKITSKSFETTYLPGGEGCLSVDRATQGLTPRSAKITFEAHHLDLQTHKIIPITMDLDGYAAIVFQHEYDHLDGIMFTTKLYPKIPHAKPLFTVDSD